MAKSESSKSNKHLERIDRIGSLPEPLLSCILSFLPTKFAVTTSLLSKRWEFLWTSITNLEFDGEDFRLRYSSRRDIRRKIFTQFVNRVLLLNTSCIQNFHLKCNHIYCDPLDIHSWVCAAVRRTFQKLELRLLMTQSMKLSVSHFRYKTLADLKLKGDIHFKIAEAASISFPNLHTFHLSEIEFSVANNCSVSFPNLKDLLLDSVRYTDEESVNKLFANSSALENLIIIRSGKDNAPNLVISIPSLISLRICFWDFPSPWPSRVRLYTPSLQYLSLKDDSLCCFDSIYLPFLLEARINLWCLGIIEDSYRTNMSDFFEVLFNVELLSLEGGAVFEIISSISANIALVFRYLQQLEIRRYGCWCLSVVLNNLLESMDTLEHLVFIGKKYCGKSGPWWMEPLQVPICLLHSITTISFTDVACDCNDEVELVSYFLKNAKALKMLTLGKVSGTEAEKLKFMHKLLTSPKGSLECQFDVDIVSDEESFDVGIVSDEESFDVGIVSDEEDFDVGIFSDEEGFDDEF